MSHQNHRQIDPEIGSRMFLRAIDDHPWAKLDLIQSYSGLLDWEIALRYHPLAKDHGWIERGEIPAPDGSKPRRFGLTPAGAAMLGRQWSLAASRDSFLRALHLDHARQLLAEWVSQGHALLWSLSPFTLPTKAVRPPKRLRPVKQKKKADFAYRAVRLNGLACLKFGPGTYLNVAVIIDPGGINVTWFFHQFRSLYAWRRRVEFKENQWAFPVVVMVAATERRRVMLTQLWRATAIGISPLRFRITTQARLASPALERAWWNERGQATKLWGGVLTAPLPSARPAQAKCRWWGDVAADEVCADLPSPTFQLSRHRPGLLEWAKRPKQTRALSAQLVKCQLELKALGRGLLKQLGAYPLLRVGELALVMSQARSNISATLKELQKKNVISAAPHDEREYLLTWRGVALLAAQAGFAPNEYAELRRWPVHRDESGRSRYSVESLVKNYEHTRLVMSFMVGLRRFGPDKNITLRQWDHLQCLQIFPSQAPHPALRRLRWTQDRIIPDAKGVVRAYDPTAAHYMDTRFWLEVDLGSHRGARLNQKLERYYAVGGPHGGAQGRGVRLLMLVGHEDEARLQLLRRRLRDSNQRYHTQLSVWLTRVDLLADQWGRLDPTRAVWRTLESSQFVSAFN